MNKSWKHICTGHFAKFTWRFKRVGCSVTEQRVQIGTWFVPTHKRRARVYVPCGRTMVSSKQAHVIRTPLQIRYGFLYGTTFSPSTGLRLFIVNLYCLKAGDFYVSQIVTNASTPCTSSSKIFSFPKGRKRGRCSLSRSELQKKILTFASQFALGTILQAKMCRSVLWIWSDRRLLLNGLWKMFVKLRKCYPLILCVCVDWKKSGINRFKWRTRSAKVT